MILICILNEIIKIFSSVNMLILPTDERYVFNDLTSVVRLISFGNFKCHIFVTI